MGWGKKVGIGCGAVLAVAIVLGVGIFLVVRMMTAEPERVVREFLDAAAAGDYAKAHGCFSVPLKERQPLEQFTEAVKGNPSLFAVTDMTFTERSIDGSGAKLVGAVTIRAGTRVPASFNLVKENDSWKLIAYDLGPKS